jgi:predicted flap endonuclease-1-like 5' DNA nuclease
MTQWMIDYWYLCLAALMIGVATAGWIWLGRGSAPTLPEREIDEPRAPLEPVKPVIERAESINFATPPSPDPVPTAPAALPADAALTAAADRPAIAVAVGAPDNLLAIKGVGPKLNTLLSSLGITRYDQIAAWTDTDVAEVDRFLGVFAGRIVRDAWVEQAGYLARGDTAGFAARFGELGG